MFDGFFLKIELILLHKIGQTWFFKPMNLFSSVFLLKSENQNLVKQQRPSMVFNRY